MTSQTTYEGVHNFIYTKNTLAKIGGPDVHTTQKRIMTIGPEQK